MQPDLESGKSERCKRLAEGCACRQRESSFQFDMRADAIRDSLKKAIIDKVHSLGDERFGRFVHSKDTFRDLNSAGS